MIIRIINNLFLSNTYLVFDEFKSECILIDPGLNEEITEHKIKELKLEPVAIFATHGHFDHIGGVSYFKEKYNIPFFLHTADFKLMKSANFILKMWKVGKIIKIPKPEVLLTDKYQKIDFPNFTFEFFNFPGHTDGSCIIKYKNNIFTGDIIFRNKVFVNNLPGENVELLKTSVKEIFKVFSSSDICYPGHGSEATLLEIKSTNLELKSFISE
jgi:glyoxylase-like metal-dependent hydrolase (beta-lactamase superfamily II)